jgi:hypothetical protein
MTSTATVKHTPGKWTSGHAGVQRRPVVVAARAGRPVTVATIDSGNKDEDEANARLIAAAPDLLAALRNARAALGIRDDFVPLGCMEIAAEIDACLIKAEGRAS